MEFAGPAATAWCQTPTVHLPWMGRESLTGLSTNFKQVFAPDQPVYGLQTIGPDGEKERHACIEEMASHYVSEIRAFQPEGPYYLAGYSMGGLVAMEMAEQLRRQGQRVAFLGLLDTNPISVSWIDYVVSVAPYLWQRFKFHVKQLRAMPLREYVGYVRDRWEKLRWWINKNRRMPKVVMKASEKNTSEPQLPGIQDYYKDLACAYRLRRYAGSINVFISEADNSHMVRAWSRLARDGATIHQLTGNHLEIIRGEHGPETAKALKAALECAQQDSYAHL